MSLGDLDKALELFKKAADIFDEQKDFTNCANNFDNMGTAYLQKKDTSTAMLMYERSFHIAEKAKSRKHMAQALSSLATVHMSRKNYDVAEGYFRKALQLSEEGNNAQKICHVLNKMSMFNYLKGNIAQAQQLAERNFKLSKQYGFTENIRNAAEILWKIYDKKNQSGKAYEMFKLFVSLRDTLFNKELQKTTVRKQFEYEYDKRSLEDSLNYAKEKQLKDAELATQGAELKAKRNQQYALFGGLALVMVFSGFMYNRFKVTQRQKVVIEAKEKETHSQNIIITQQKHLVEEKHKEITDSINYAERIQRSFMATKDLLDHKLGEYFVLFKPKDVVSGDFYWAEEAYSKFYIATADSTGHGVPGAIMSLLNITSLERAIENYQDPDQILNHTRKTIISRLKRDGSAEGGKDGMDCSLLCFDSTKNVLTVAAAHNPVWIIRTNNKVKELIEIKGDKMPVGKHDNDQISFTLHTVQLQKGDVIYTLTDGFPDQFGGDNGKKFMSKRLKELLQSISHLNLSEQKQTLEETFGKWIGNLEQVDDVTVIGIKV
jgi:serine phosphatase RsbU (regulator of sigma subunit)